MDACDPDVKTKNIRKMLKIHTGRDLNISKERMCEISIDIAKGNLPLPPLVLTRDKRYLLDPKSPLTRRDYESLYKSNVTSRVVKRIAKKIGLVDLKKPIVELKHGIGRRLMSLKIREPILLPGSRVISKMQFNNSPRNLNINNNRENQNRNRNGDNNQNRNRNGDNNQNRNRNGDNNQNRNRNGDNKFSPMTNNKLRNMVTRRRQKERAKRAMGGGFFSKSSNSNRPSGQNNGRTSNNRNRIQSIQQNANKRVQNTKLAAQRHLSEARIINGRRKKRQFNVVENKLRLEQRNKFRAENNTRRAQVSENRSRKEKRRVQLNANINAQRANNIQGNYEHLRRSSKIKMNQMKLVSGEALIAAKKMAVSSEKYKKELSNRKTNLNVLQKNLTTKESEIQRITQEVKELQQKVNTSSNNGTKPTNTSQLNQSQKKLENMQRNRNKIQGELSNVRTELAAAKKSLKNLENQNNPTVPPAAVTASNNTNKPKGGTIAPPSSPALTAAVTASNNNNNNKPKGGTIAPPSSPASAKTPIRSMFTIAGGARAANKAAANKTARIQKEINRGRREKKVKELVHSYNDKLGSNTWPREKQKLIETYLKNGTANNRIKGELNKLVAKKAAKITAQSRWKNAVEKVKKAAANNGAANNGAANNGAANNGAAKKTAANNGAAKKTAANNGAAKKTAANNGAAKKTAANKGNRPAVGIGRTKAMSAAENTVTLTFRSKIERAVKNKKLHPINAKRYRNFLNGKKYIGRSGKVVSNQTLENVATRLKYWKRSGPDGEYYVPSKKAIKGQNGKNVLLGGNDKIATLSNSDKKAFVSRRKAYAAERKQAGNNEGSMADYTPSSTPSRGGYASSSSSPLQPRKASKGWTTHNASTFVPQTTNRIGSTPRRNRPRYSGPAGNETRKKNEANNCIPIFGRATCAALDRGRARVESGLFGGSKRPPSHLVQGTGQKREVKK